VRAFACPVCGGLAAFDSERCSTCGAALGLHLPTKSMVPIIDGAALIDGRRWVRCTQYASNIPPVVATKLGFVHRVVGEAAGASVVEAV
jgi:hypothetical protein